jgi:hypothetical protein
MFDELKKYKNNGHFFFKSGNSLLAVSKDVPNLQGVYYIVRLAKGRVDVVYIGKSGTITQDGKFKEQGLRGGINNEHDGQKRQGFFEMKCISESIDGLDIYWFVTFDKDIQDVPGYVEGLLMQNYFDVHGQLPPWNKCF